ncbi:MAG TPA: ethanolamine ammonia lyase-activating protein [Thermoanaerobaculia bacterium]
MRRLIAKLYRGLVSQRDVADRLSRESAESILDSVKPLKDFRFEQYSEKTPYRQWIDSEQIPIHTGYHIPDVRQLALGPWERLGALGAHVVVEGAEGTDAAYLCEIPVGGRTKPQRYLFEEVIYVLDGEGETVIWQDSRNKRNFRWSKGSLFSPPLNVWREHVNRGQSPAKFIAVTDLPIVIDLFHNTQFVFNNDFVFIDRYDNQDDYFACGPDKIRKGRAPGVTGKGRGDSYECSLIPDARSLPLFEAEARGRRNRTSEIQLADNTLQCHVSEFPVGTYKRAHRHGPGSHVIVLGGRGYTLMWKDSPRFSEAKTQMRIDWNDGSLFVPPDHWFHQHFNGGERPARYLAATWIGGKYFAEGLGGGGRTHRLGTVSVHHGGNMIDYTDEDPAIRSLFEEELKKSGVLSEMPSRS